MGILGALSHHSRWKWLIPAILLTFEYWNQEYNNISEYVTWGHLSSALFGFIIWGAYLKRINLDEKLPVADELNYRITHESDEEEA